MPSINLQSIGLIEFDKVENPKLNYIAVFTDYKINDEGICIKIETDSIDSEVIKRIDTTLSSIVNMDKVVRQDYFNDFNDDEEHNYVNSIYKKILAKKDFEKLSISKDNKEKLLLSLDLYFIDISIKQDNIFIWLSYAKGYELELKYRFNENFELKESILQARGGIIKEQLSGFFEKWETPEVNEICGRVDKNWTNYPTRSYFIYRMVKRIQKHLQIR